jgi:transposase
MMDPATLRRIAHRTVEQQQALTLTRAWNVMVRLRTAAVNAVRVLTKSCGHRMPASTTRRFAKRSLAATPAGLAEALNPVLDQIAQMTLQIKRYDRQIQEVGQTTYPETQALAESSRRRSHHGPDLRPDPGKQGTVQAGGAAV